MSEMPNEIYGEGVYVSGIDVTWFRERPSGYPFSDDLDFTLTDPFGDET